MKDFLRTLGYVTIACVWLVLMLVGAIKFIMWAIP